MKLVNRKKTSTARPYLCPGCETPLDAIGAVAVDHMENCELLQQMIAIARYAHELRSKNVEAIRVKTK